MATRLFERCFGPMGTGGSPARHSYLWPRWLFLRALGLLFGSAFYSLARQIHGLIGSRGLLPAADYLHDLAGAYSPLVRVWLAPSLLWLGAGDLALDLLVGAGLLASAALVLNLWPRLSLLVCGLCFLSFVAAARDFSSYQSDGMLLEACFISLFFAPPGLRPRLAAAHPPSWAALWLLRWEWFRIYFESGVVKLASGDPQWRDLSAMDLYYQNGPLPTWLGWYAHQLPHRFHAATALLTLIMELVLVWLLFLPRPFRLALAAIATLLQAGIILTANYAFLNYLVLALGVLLLDDRLLCRPGRLELPAPLAGAEAGLAPTTQHTVARAEDGQAPAARQTMAVMEAGRVWARRRRVAGAVILIWAFYATVVGFVGRALPRPLVLPAIVLTPFRIANNFGLFGVMTRERHEIEFQGTTDGRNWIAYPFRYKPQDPKSAPGIYAPYQPRFEWNLWFASLEPWQDVPWVLAAEARLLEREPAVLGLFARDPFGGRRPMSVRTMVWRYRFTDTATRRRTGDWWVRDDPQPYAPAVEAR